MAKNLSTKILSEVVTFQKYSRYLPEKLRRESWKELVDRNQEMHTTKFPNMADAIKKHFKLVRDKKVLPSMRSFQFAGTPIQISPNRIYNCAYAPVEHPDIFSEAMFLLLGGTGLGYSVQKHHVRQLPPVLGPSGRTRRFLVGDSIEGWADAIKALFRAYFENKAQPRFDFSDIRQKGALLVTSGGKAPGPQPLKDCLYHLNNLLDEAIGRQLRPIECHDALCRIADAVLAGGIRRAAMISLFSFDDQDMLLCKSGNWWETNGHRARSNNSAMILRNRIKKEEFQALWRTVEVNRSGEPGIYFSNDMDWGTNPCCEIALRPYQFCNLTTINGSDVKTQEEFNRRAESASFIGTLQASFTDFHYLRPIWQRTTEKDSLIGVSITGIASGGVLNLNLTAASQVVKETNEKTAKELGINKAARTTCVKPEGTSSLVLGTSSGIHAWHNDYYLRRIKVGKNEALYKYLSKKIPEYIEDDERDPSHAFVVLPIKAPAGAILRTEPAADLLARIAKVSTEWVKPGHNTGRNTHNVSATVTIKDDEWKMVGEWAWKNREIFNGLAMLPHDGGSYIQMPFEDCTKYRYDKDSKGLTDINLTRVKEEQDETDLQGEIACAGGACEVTY